VLSRRIGSHPWHTPRVEELLPRLHEAVGVRPRLPRKRDLWRIRYTPITRPFKAVAELSWRIAQLEGFSASSEAGRAEGILLDVAELWELFVVNCMRRAVPPGLTVVHGTVDADSAFLMQSRPDPSLGLGRLKPDILVLDEATPVVIADAKYKLLRDRWPDRPRGVDRADLYQLTSYLSRFAATGHAAGALLYPHAPGQTTEATAEASGPWQTEAGNNVHFKRLPVDPDGAVEALKRHVSDATGEPSPVGPPDAGPEEAPATPHAAVVQPAAPNRGTQPARARRPASPPPSRATVSQNVTAKDLQAGRIRFPRATQGLFPSERGYVDVVVRGRVFAGVRWDPRHGPDRERAGLLSFGRHKLDGLLAEGEVLAVTANVGGTRVELH
jgi:McrBC 5-methylcytosine restriction system component